MNPRFRRKQCMQSKVARRIRAKIAVAVLFGLCGTSAPGIAQQEAYYRVARLPAPDGSPHEPVEAPVEELPTPAPLPPVYEPAPPVELAAPAMPTEEPWHSAGEIGFCEFCGSSCGADACCNDCRDCSRWGRFTRSLYRGLCCPDPCYQPEWRPLTDAAFFTTAVRPQNQQRFRWDYVEGLSRPDRAEYFWARTGASGRGPTVSAPSALADIDYDELRHYIEVAHGSFGAWFEYSYRALDVDGRHLAGFGDMTIGTKTLLYDTELAQVAFQFQTHVPQGASLEGLGTGHVSLEPGLVFGVNFSPSTFIQAEVSEWIPLGGDSQFEGALFRYNASLNQILARPHPCVPLIGVLEINGWRFQDGAFTDPVSGATVAASGGTYLNAAAGLRVFFDNRADFGVSYATPATTTSWANAVIRSELRFRY